MKCSWLTPLIAVAALSGAVSGAAAASPEQQTPQAGQTFRDCSDCPEMAVIPAGNFLMGSSDEETARDVDVVLPNNERRYAQKVMALEHPSIRLASTGRSGSGSTA
jgi:formylglycine-generating enzyme required for sulfatase activity